MAQTYSGRRATRQLDSFDKIKKKKKKMELKNCRELKAAFQFNLQSVGI